MTPQTFSVGQNASLVIKAHSSNISVHSGGGNTIGITSRSHSGTAAPDPNSVRVVYTQDHDAQGHDRLTVTPDPFFTALDFAVTIPTTATVQITIDSGSLDIHGGQDLTATTTNGNIVLDTIQGPVDLTTTNGDVTASGITGDTKIADINGSLSLKRIKGQTKSAMVNGDVSASDMTLSGN